MAIKVHVYEYIQGNVPTFQTSVTLTHMWLHFDNSSPDQRVEIIVGKGEIAHCEIFSLFPHNYFKRSLYKEKGINSRCTHIYRYFGGLHRSVHDLWLLGSIGWTSHALVLKTIGSIIYHTKKYFIKFTK